jgi:hypothetical protein
MYLTFDPSWQFNFCSLMLFSSSLSGATTSYNFCCVVLKQNLGDEVKDSRGGRTCDSYGGKQVLGGKPEGRRPHGGSGLDGRMMVKCILKKCGGREWTGTLGLRIATSGRLL